jgi:RNA polymerase sigma factor (sigma-70 family)
MQNWQKDRNYRKIKQSDGILRYIITIDDEDVEVTEEVFAAYSQADRRERYCAEREARLLLSLEEFNLDCFAPRQLDVGIQMISVEDAALRRLALDEMTAAFNTLNADDRCLLTALVMDGMPEREYAALIGISQKGVNKRKKRALQKVLEIMVLNHSDFREEK